IGVLRESIGSRSEPDSEDFAKVTQVFNRALAELEAAGATVIDPIVIPDLHRLEAKRASLEEDERAFQGYFGRGGNAPFTSRREMVESPEYAQVIRPRGGGRGGGAGGASDYPEYLAAREELMINVLKVMADHGLDAIASKSVEHQPNLISEGIGPPYYSSRGATHLNTSLVYVPMISVPAGFSSDHLPVGIAFLGRAYTEGVVIRLAYAYEQATSYRTPPATTPRLPGEP
ncbi:MAG: hypothetical protein HY534_00360, partial [Chloroflexi bacterium]|nr:hypothetical protein [Chloroflexota bacterium]